jgi:Golgi apparatus protein 1
MSNPYPNPSPRHPRECKDEVTRDANRAAGDFRLNWRLNHACESDVATLCGGLCATSSAQPCGGVVLHCLSDKRDNITSAACQEVGRLLGLCLTGAVLL